MDDALELSVHDNEFDAELPSRNETQNISEISDVKIQPNRSTFDPSDYISLTEAKEKLLQSLEEYELKDDVMLCARGSVKSRLGVRQENVELMDCSESKVLDNESTNEERLGEDHRTSADIHTLNTATECSHRKNDLPRRPSMKNLCKRLRVRWYDNPVKIGQEIAKRLEEHKFSLIIETVKIIGGKRTLELFNETKRIQLNGGMKTANGLRRRTSGGVFFTLLKSSNYATDKQIKEIFKEDMSMRKKAKALRRKKAAHCDKQKQTNVLGQQETQSNSSNIEQQDSKTVENDIQDSIKMDSNTNEISHGGTSV